MKYILPVRETRYFYLEVFADTASEAMDAADLLIEKKEIGEPVNSEFEVVDAWLEKEKRPVA